MNAGNIAATPNLNIEHRTAIQRQWTSDIQRADRIAGAKPPSRLNGNLADSANAVQCAANIDGHRRHDRPID